jgi:hypothetical protein
LNPPRVCRRSRRSDSSYRQPDSRIERDAEEPPLGDAVDAPERQGGRDGAGRRVAPSDACRPRGAPIPLLEHEQCAAPRLEGDGNRLGGARGRGRVDHEAVKEPRGRCRGASARRSERPEQHTTTAQAATRFRSSPRSLHRWSVNTPGRLQGPAIRSPRPGFLRLSRELRACKYCKQYG